MRKTIGFIIALAAAGLLAGCSGNGAAGQTSAAQTTAEQTATEQTSAWQCGGDSGRGLWKIKVTPVIRYTL